jgi:excisionase family DNA binding protein
MAWQIAKCGGIGQIAQAIAQGRGGMSGRTPEVEQLLTPAEVAALFRVDPKTVTRWAKAGKLSSIRTLGGHRRYRAAEVHGLLDAIPGRRDESTGTNGPRPTPPPGYVLPPQDA